MKIFDSLFPQKDKIECPRCLGKGFVDKEDIVRLKKQNYWAPGKCAYCKGKGKIHPELLQKLRFDLEYLTIDLPKEEMKNLENGNLDSWSRANHFKDEVQILLKHIDYLHEVENLSIPEIAEHMTSLADVEGTEEVAAEWISYIENYIKSKAE